MQFPGLIARLSASCVPFRNVSAVIISDMVAMNGVVRSAQCHQHLFCSRMFYLQLSQGHLYFAVHVAHPDPNVPFDEACCSFRRDRAPSFDSKAAIIRIGVIMSNKI